MNLPTQWIERIFAKLQGAYGYGFTSKFATGMVNGVDSGIENAKLVWAEEPGTASDLPEAIGYALKHLPSEKAPNVFEFRDACRRAPRKSEAVAAIEYKPTAEDVERHKEMAHKAAEAVRPKEFDGLLWAKKPKSQKAMDAIADAKKNARHFPALAAVFDRLVNDGVANEAGKLLYRWDGIAWVKL